MAYLLPNIPDFLFGVILVGAWLGISKFIDWVRSH